MQAARGVHQQDVGAGDGEKRIGRGAVDGVGIGGELGKAVVVVERELRGEVLGLEEGVGDIEEGVDGGVVEEGSGGEIGVADIGGGVAHAAANAHELKRQHDKHYQRRGRMHLVETLGRGMTQAAQIVEDEQTEEQRTHNDGRKGEAGQHIGGIGGIDEVGGIHLGSPKTVQHHVGGKGQGHERSSQGIVEGEHPLDGDFVEEKGEGHHQHGNNHQVAGGDGVESQTVEKHSEPSSHSGALGIGQIEKHEHQLLGDEQQQQRHIQAEEEEEPFSHIIRITKRHAFYCAKEKNMVVDNFLLKKKCLFEK